MFIQVRLDLIPHRIQDKINPLPSRQLGSGNKVTVSSHQYNGIDLALQNK